MKPQVRPDIKRKRWEILNELKQEKKKAFVQRFVGKTLEGIVESRSASIKGHWSGLTENYIPLIIKEEHPELAGKVKKFKIIEAFEDHALAELSS